MFRLDRDSGRIRREGVFLISSEDYYSLDNYATRLVGDNLILYNLIGVEDLVEDSKWPVVRRWMPESERATAGQRGRRLLDAHDIYRPLLRTEDPYVHSISICPLGDGATEDSLDCTTTALTGPLGREFFVTPDAAFLWLWASPYEYSHYTRTHYRGRRSERQWPGPASCTPGEEFGAAQSWPGALYRIPIDGGAPTVIGVAGAPIDQFSMDVRRGVFQGLALWVRPRCAEAGASDDEEREDDLGQAAYSLAQIALGDFSRTFFGADERRYTALPYPGDAIIENRFADDYLVYGGRNQWGPRPPSVAAYHDNIEEGPQGPETASVVTVPLDAPEATTVIRLPHNIIRIERFGDEIILDGYRDDSGLHVSLLDIGPAPRIAGTTFLPSRFESEGRSHAFNARIDADGGGILAFPTVEAAQEVGPEWWWDIEASDVSFLGVSPDGGFMPRGELTVEAREPHVGYRCEVSCVDWYGNSRPIFTMGRIFALMGTELVEGRIEGGRIVEIGRLDLTAPIGER